MGIKGDFTADFSQFTAAVEGAQTTLRQFEANSNTVAASLQRMVDSLNGNKMIADATLMAEAVERLGGVAKLTDAELQSLGKEAAEAVAKMEKLGLDVPANLQQLADAAKTADQNIEGLGSRITGLVQAGQMAAQAMSALVATGTDWIQSATAQEDATVRMTTALKAQGTYTPQLVDQYSALATEFEQTTGYSDELLTEMEALLATVGGVMPRDMRAALTAATDLAAGMRIDLPDATMKVAKALEGNTTALHKAGIEVDGLALKTQGASVLFDAIADKMGGNATAQAATFGGELRRLNNVVDNTKEDLGTFMGSVMKPLIDTFISMPAPVREGAVAFGLVGKAAGELALGIGGLMGAAKLAMPLLGFGAAAEGAGILGGLSGAFGTLGIAAGAAAIPLGLVAAAIASIWAAWKIGDTETVKNSIATWALSADNLTAKLFRWAAGLEQLTPEQAKAAVAATAAGEAALANAKAVDTATDAHTRAAAATPSYTALLAQAQAQVDALSASQIAEVEAAKKFGASQQDIERQFHLNAAAQSLLTTRLQEQQAEAKKSAAAWAEINSAGATYQDTLAGMTTTMKAHVEAGLAAGVSQGALVTAYGATETQVRAVDTAMKEHLKTLAAIAKIETDTRTQKEAGILGLDKLQQESTQKEMENASKGSDAIGKAYKQLHDMEMQTTLDATTYKVMKIWEAADEQVKAFQGTAQQAQQHSDLIYQIANEQANRIYETTTYHFDAVKEGLLVDVKAAADAIKGIAKDADDAISATTQHMQTMQGGTKLPGSHEETRFGQRYLVSPTGAAVPLGPHGELPGNWFEMYSGQQTGAMPFMTPPARAAGGPVAGGSTYLVGEKGPELFVPTDSGMILPNNITNNLTNHFNMVDTAENLARRVADVLMRSIMNGRKLGSA